MKKNYLQMFLSALLIFFATSSAYAHCEIPCGIYDDVMRLNMISEHVKTIEKSMEQILELQKKKPINHNQLVRWINNKEDHANKVQEIISQYFLTQRIRFDDKDYAKKLAVLHKIMVSAMKCKQTVDLANLKTLRAACREFEDFYREEDKEMSASPLK
ncbi:MAG: superoxide dismutase [Desulfobulbaceae bacterium]|nr:superoxide dismutase [Desulfobulbaceae bacterium]